MAQYFFIQFSSFSLEGWQCSNLLLILVILPNLLMNMLQVHPCKLPMQPYTSVQNECPTIQNLRGNAAFSHRVLIAFPQQDCTFFRPVLIDHICIRALLSSTLLVHPAAIQNDPTNRILISIPCVHSQTTIVDEEQKHKNMNS
jgi:hypothetical protein